MDCWGCFGSPFRHLCNLQTSSSNTSYQRPEVGEAEFQISLSRRDDLTHRTATMDLPFCLMMYHLHAALLETHHILPSLVSHRIKFARQKHSRGQPPEILCQKRGSFWVLAITFNWSIRINCKDACGMARHKAVSEFLY